VTRGIALLAVLGLAISIYLTWVHYAGIEPVCTGISDCERVQTSEYAWAELFRIEAICQWCVGSALITLVIAVLATVRALGAPLHQRALS